MLEKRFKESASKFSSDEALVSSFWNEIKEQHSQKVRHYHTLQHLENLTLLLSEIKDQIENWDMVVFAIAYHDIVYNSLNSDNEEKSQRLAEKKLSQLHVPENLIQICSEHILATKKHSLSNHPDTNLFTDADLSILGHDWPTYQVYFQQVRKEYSIYPDLLYNPGRKKVLQHFLQMERIFKTEYFFDKFERQSRLNLKEEMDLL